MAAPKFKKGQQVWQFINWNFDDTVAFRLVTVESWGAKHGTVSIVGRDGKMSESRIYTQHVNHTDRMCDYGGEHFFANPADPEATAVELAKLLIECNISRLEQILVNPMYDREYTEAKLAKLRAATPKAHAY